VAFERSVPVRLLPPVQGNANVAAPPRINPLADEPDHGRRGTWTRGAPLLDPLAHDSQNFGHVPSVDLLFDGTANPFACGGCTPPDPVGAVGKDYYIQVVNATKVAIFNKADGSPANSPFDLGSLWTTGICTSNVGDPVVQYDQFGDRWLLTQLGSPHHVCVAISQTGDPLGAYFLYTFDVTEFPDYFKLGVWPNGYYGSANQSSYAAFAFNRTKMLAGDPSAEVVRFAGETNFLMPASADGTKAPKGGGLFYTFKDDQFHGGQDRLEVFQLNPDFANIGNSTFKLVDTIPIAAFTYTVCGFFNFDCIPQKGTSAKVDAVSEWPMQRLAWRKWKDATSLVGAFTVGGGNGSAGAAVRWFELRKVSGHWTLYQEGTQDLDDGLDRFMASISMDRRGNIALGYSVSSSNAFPSIRYATRTKADPLGTLGKEKVLKAGGGSQTGSDRWGDYTAMTIDPVDGCQFWYTNEYYEVSASTSWKTAIGAFHLCRR